MIPYTTNNPSFSESVSILQITDTNHADNFNISTKQLLQNTLVLYDALISLLDEENMEASFLSVFTKTGLENSESLAMTAAEIEEAIATPWNGE